MGNLGDVAVHANVAFADQFLDARSAKLRHSLREKQIQPSTRITRCGSESLLRSNAGFSLRIFLWYVQCRESLSYVILDSAKIHKLKPGY